MARPRKSKPHRLSRAIAELRESLGLTQQQLADKLNCSLSAVAMAETQRLPTLAMVAQVRRVLLQSASVSPDGLPILTAEQRKHDDVLYRYLVQHSDAHRTGLSTSIQACTSQALGIIVAAAVAQQSDRPTLDPDQTAKIAEYLNEIAGFAGLLIPIDPE